MFSGGLDPKTLSEKTAPEIRTITATQYVGEDKDDGGESMYVVDFEGVAKAFLWVTSICLMGIFSQLISIQVIPLTNLLRFVLRGNHQVEDERHSQLLELPVTPRRLSGVQRSDLRRS